MTLWHAMLCCAVLCYEATAECAKTKLFPVAATAKIQFAIKKAVQPHVTYKIYCKVEKENAPGVSYDVSGRLCDANDEAKVHATCLATMANIIALSAGNK